MAYQLDLEAWDEDVSGNDTLIERHTETKILQPSSQWETRRHDGSTALMEYKIKVECDPNYYGPQCSNNCEARDDYHGHYKCSPNGEKICLGQWKGEYCTEPICAAGCHPEHGYCKEAGECRCRSGWRGDNCDQCQVRQGCQHGSCEKPFECNCEPYWGGDDCAINLNICGDRPCQNGARCENQYGNFSCTCPSGFSGKYCEHADHSCATAPCQNGGSCRPDSKHPATAYTCHCRLGFYGEHCEFEIDECLNAPCANGGVCHNLQGDFECECAPGWMGKTCQIDIDECTQDDKCINHNACVNFVGDFQCICKPGWTGKLCDQNINECANHQPCLNGAICVDTPGSFACQCQAGFTGALCELDIDECATSRCQNGGTCTDLINGYKCRCPAGFSGKHCEVPMGFCSRSPCQNGGICFNVDADYECQCPIEFDGKNCQNIRDQCKEPNTQCKVLDACETEVATATRYGYQKRIDSSKQCGSHGTCSASSMSQRQCRCAPGFTGEFCHENIDECAHNPCLNGGTCIDGDNAYQCACKPGYTGSTCQTRVNVCETQSTPCANGAKCRPGHLDDFHCTCRAGWFGKRCNLRSTDGLCSANPCKSGKCIETKRGNGFTCQCPSDRTGSLCQYVKHTLCTRANPCGAHGKCEDLSFDGSDAYQCHCRDGWQGEHCDKEIDHCSPNPCFNGAECINGDNHYECRCKPGFDGPECRHNIDECASNPCAIGATCVDGVDTFRCECPKGRTGHLCEQLIEAPHQRSCSYKGDLFVHSYEWKELCNACSCTDGKTTCTQIDCGLTECSKYDTCGPGQECYSLDTPSNTNCVSATCTERFFCLPADHSNSPLMDEKCDIELSHENTAKINLQFKVDQISQLSEGVHSTDVCAALRYLEVLKTYATGQDVTISCCSSSIGTVVVTIEHDNAADVAKEIRMAVIEGPVAVDTKDRHILQSIYDVDIIKTNDATSTVWLIIAVLLSILLVLILILGAFIIRYKTRGFNHGDESNYTLGSSSGCTDQLVMTSSPSTTDQLHHHNHHQAQRSGSSDLDQFIWVAPNSSTSQTQRANHKSVINGPIIFQNQRYSHLIRTNQNIVTGSHSHLHQHSHSSPPPSYDESSRYYSTIQPSTYK